MTIRPYEAYHSKKLKELKSDLFGVNYNKIIILVSVNIELI